jgi:general secretion pathway protein I
MSLRARTGFTLLEVIIAMAILGLALMAIFDLNSGAVAMHAYTKRLTVASLLARSKMTDLEQELYDKGFSADDEEKNGDFSNEGWDSFKWRAKILAPKTQGLTPEQMVTALFNIPLGSTELGPLSDLFGDHKSSSDKGGSKSGSTSSTTAVSSGLGPLAGLIQGQFTQMLDQLTKAVREVHLTVAWREGNNVETLDLVTHVVSLGPGSDRNGNLAAANANALINAGALGPGGQPIPPNPQNTLGGTVGNTGIFPQPPPVPKRDKR